MRQHSSRGRALGGLVALAAAIGIGRFVYTPILPDMVVALGWSQSEAGLVASANFLGYLAGALMTTAATVSAKPRPWLVGMLAISGATTVGMAVGESSGAMMVLRFVGGVASAFVIVCASALVLDGLPEEEKSSTASLHFSGVGLGIAVSALVVGQAALTGFGWQGMWAAVGALALLAIPVVGRVLPSGQASARPLVPGAAGAFDGRLARLALAYGLFGFGYIITATFLVSIVRDTPEIRAWEPWIWVLVGLSAMPSVAIWFSAARVIGPTRAFALAACVLALGVLASVEWPTAAGAVTAAVLLGGTFMGLTALGLVAARTVAGVAPVRAMGWMTVSFAVGQMIGPMFGGVMYDLTATHRLSSLAAVVALLIAALIASRLTMRTPSAERLDACRS